MEKDVLKSVGLTPGESKVYLALLELGPSTTGAIVRQSGVARSIIYQLLDNLAQKGLVSYVVQGKVKHYQPAEPNRIYDYLEDEKKKLEESRKKFDDMVPQLLALQKSAKETEVKVFRGFKGMMAVHENMYAKLGKGEDYYYLNIPPEQPPFFHAYWKGDHLRRAKAGIGAKLLFDKRTEETVLKNRNSYKGCDARYMPIDVSSVVWFFGYKDVAVIVVPSAEPISIEITNQEVADAFRAYFEEFWGRSRPF